MTVALRLLVHGQQPVDDRTQRVLVIDELQHVDAELPANRAWEQKAAFLE
jgi:hypothetical protein